MRDVLHDCAQLNLEHELAAELNLQTLLALRESWAFCAREEQWPPLLTEAGLPWTVWLFLGGRGAGKTRAGAEWVKSLALGDPLTGQKPCARIALVGESAADVRDVMIEGVSGLLSVHGNDERPVFEPSRRRVRWQNGAVAQIFSAEDPESLRGPQFAAAWCDELAKWRYADETWNMLQFALRLGDNPRQMVTTTPRPTALIKRLMAAQTTVITHATTHANAENLAPSFLAQIVARYEGTFLGRQELLGDVIEARQGALWTPAQLEACRETQAGKMVRIVVAVDPPTTSSRRADACGIVAAGIDEAAIIHVLEDATINEARPHHWAQRAVGLYHKLEADCLVAEVNQGGEMVTAVIAEQDANVPVTMVRAKRGKYLRAAPVAHLYEQGRVRHQGSFPALEDEMCAMGSDGFTGGHSPDRVDALVWAITALALTPEPSRPRMRVV